MKKYKLINTETKEETLCDKVVIDGFDYYVSDEKSLSNNGDWYLGYPNYDTLFKWEMTGIHEGKQVWINKVIATNNPNINIPKVVDEVERLAYEHCDKVIPKDVTRSLHYSFKCGYNKSQETHPFSEEDMIEFYRWLNKNSWQDYNDIKQGLFVNSYGVQKQDKELLQLWKEQKPKTVYYE